MSEQKKKIPVYHKIIQLTIYQEIQPVVTKEIQPIINKKIQPVVHKEIQPIIHQEIQPVITLLMDSNLDNNSQPIINRKIQPVIHKEIQPIINQEIQPVITEEIQPIIKEMIQPVIFNEKETNIEEMIQQIYQYYTQYYEEVDPKIKVGLKGLNPDKNYNLQKQETFDKAQFPNDKNEIVPYIIKEEKQMSQNIIKSFTQKEEKIINQIVVHPYIMNEEKHTTYQKIFPKTEKYINNIEQFEVVPYIMREEKHITQKKEEPTKKTKEQYTEEIIIVPYIQYENGETLPYEKKDKDEKIYTKIDSDNKEKIITINFINLEKNINYPIDCQKTDVFEKIEKQLYQKFPELLSKKYNFIANEKVIDKTATFEANGIKTGDNILINENEN